MVCSHFILLLDKVVSKSKMDWVDIRVDKKGNPYIYDLENNCKISFKKGVKQIYEGICDLQSIGFTSQEENNFFNCCKCVMGE